jgi:hypothetical protein
MSSLLIYQRKSGEAIPFAERAIALDPSDYWAYEQMSRALAYNGRAADAKAYLGHTEEAASARAELEPFANALRAMGELPFKQRADIERLLTGLTKAGVPDLPFGYGWGSKDRLTGEEMRSLVMGHEFRGRETDTGEAYVRSTEADGTAKVSVGSSSLSGLSKVDGISSAHFGTLTSRRPARSSSPIRAAPAKSRTNTF